jgi:citrate lyase gamma subunit
VDSVYEKLPTLSSEQLTDLLGPAVETVLGTVSTLGVADVEVEAEIKLDLQAALQSALDEEITDENSAVRINLAKGTIEIDLAKLVKDSQPDDKFYGTLNGLEPNTEIVDPQLIQAALDGAIGTLLDQIPAAVAEALEDAVNNAEVKISISGTAAVPVVGTPTEFSATLEGTLAQVLGTSEPAAQFEVEGTLPAPLDTLVETVLNETVLTTIQTTLAPVVNDVLDKVADPGVLDTIFRPLVEAVRDALKPLFDEIAENVLSILVNVQEEPGEFTHPGATGEEGAAQLKPAAVTEGSFTQRAVKITVLPGDDPAATVSLASATVRQADATGEVDATADDDAAADPQPAARRG